MKGKGSAKVIKGVFVEKNGGSKRRRNIRSKSRHWVSIWVCLGFPVGLEPRSRCGLGILLETVINRDIEGSRLSGGLLLLLLSSALLPETIVGLIAVVSTAKGVKVRDIRGA